MGRVQQKAQRLSTYATYSDVQTRLGRTLTTDEQTLVTARLADVERRIKRRINDLDDKVTAGTIDIEDVIQVEADTVLRLVRNPAGLYSETDGNYSYQFDTEMASGRLEITDEDWNTLGVRQSRMVVLSPYFGDSPLYVGSI